MTEREDISMEGFTEVLNKLMKDRGENTMSLSKKMGVSDSLLSQLTRGKKNPGLKTLISMSIALDVPLSVFYGAMNLPFAQIVRELPLIHSTDLKKWEVLDDRMFPSTSSKVWFHGISDDPYAFWVLLENGILGVPSNFQAGDWLLVEPNMDVDDGDMVLTTNRTGFWGIYKYVRHDETTVILMPTSPKQKPEVIFQGDDRLVCWRISTIVRRLIKETEQE